MFWCRRVKPRVLRALAFLLGIAATPLVALGAPEEAASGIAQLRAFVEGTRAAHGEFSQRTVRSASGTAPGTAGSTAGGAREPNKAVTLTGRFAFARPGRFRWEVLRPDDQLILSDGKQVWFHDRDLDQVTVRPLGDLMGSSPAAILFGSDALEREFALRDLGLRDGVSWIEASPLRRDAGFERILIGLRQGLPIAMEVNDSFGQTTRLNFESIRRDPQPDLTQFRFVAPPNSQADPLRK